MLSIAELVGTIEEALEQGASRVSVKYDREWGYPTSVFLDYDRQMADDAVSFSARELRAVP